MGMRQERAAEFSPRQETARSAAQFEVGVQADLAMVRLVQTREPVIRALPSVWSRSRSSDAVLRGGPILSEGPRRGVDVQNVKVWERMCRRDVFGLRRQGVEHRCHRLAVKAQNHEATQSRSM